MSTSDTYAGGRAVLPAHLAPDPPQTPLRVWAAVLLVAAGAGASVVYPQAGIAGFAALLGLWGAFQVIRRPFLTLPLLFCIFPIFAVLRATHGAYHLPVFAGGIRAFPEILTVLAGIGILTRIARGAAPPRVVQDDFPVLAYILGGAYAVLIGLADHLPFFGPLNGWWVSITPTVLYLVVRWSRPSPAEIRAFVQVFAITYILLALGSFGDYIFRPTFLMRLADSERPYFVPPGWPMEVFWRVYPRMQSLLYEENLWGSLCAFVSLCCLTHFTGTRARRGVIVLFMVSTMGLMLSMSRGALVCWGTGLCVLLVLRGQHQRRVATAIVAFVAVGAVLMVVLGTRGPLKAIVDRLETISIGSAQKGEIAQDRSFQWKLGWNSFVRFPSGTGLGTQGYAAHLSGVGEHTIGDGIYFRVLAEQGFPGFVLTVFSLFGVGWVIFRHLPSCAPATRRYGMSLLAFHCGWLVQSVGANTYDFFYIAPLFWTAFGLFVAQCEHDEAQKLHARPAPCVPALNAGRQIGP